MRADMTSSGRLTSIFLIAAFSVKQEAPWLGFAWFLGYPDCHFFSVKQEAPWLSFAWFLGYPDCHFFPLNRGISAFKSVSGEMWSKPPGAQKYVITRREYLSNRQMRLGARCCPRILYIITE